MSTHDKVMFSVLAVFVIGLIGALTYALVVEKPKMREAHRALCAASGQVPASITEGSGKTSTTANFCVDGEGRVFWPYNRAK